MPKETKKTWCGLCHARCGLLMELEDGRAISVKGDPEHPINRGKTCSRGRLMLEHLYNADRLNHPLRRIGNRGDGRWQQVTWNQALDEVAERLEQLKESLGAETLAMSRGTHRTYHWDARRFLNLFGSPNITGANPICFCPSVLIETATCGAATHSDIGRSACIVIWGSCRSISSPVVHWEAIKAAKERGAKIITVDPRQTKEADLSDLWLRVRPGTDVLLMLSWLNVICQEGLFDKEFVYDWTMGFEEVCKLANKYPPSLASKMTWVPEHKIIEAARLYATSRPATITWGQGLDKSGPNAQSAILARTILRAVTGNLDVEGGERFGGAPRASEVVSNMEMEMNDVLPHEQQEKMLGGNRHRLFSFGAWNKMNEYISKQPKDYIRPVETAEIVTAHPFDVFNAMLTDKPYPVRALICQAANPLLTLADPVRTIEALRSLSLFIVMDYYMTPTAALADFVFPAACTVERDDLSVFDSGCIAHSRALDPLYERRSDYQLWRELGIRLDQAEHWPWETVEEVCDYRLAPADCTFKELKAKKSFMENAPIGRSRQLGFGTLSQKVELCSSLIENLGYDPLPRYEPVQEDSDGSYPLILITGSGFNPMYHSEQRQWPRARMRCPYPEVSIHPSTAAELGITEGDWVRIETSLGSIKQRAHLTTAVHPKMVDCQHGWWYPERTSVPEELYGVLESNANVLCRDAPEHCSAGTGGWSQTGILCRIVADKARH